MPEDDFFRDLRSVTIHLIKHDRHLYQDLIEMMEAYDRKQWAKLSEEEKFKQVLKLAGRMDELDQYYANYPHEWSRQRYEDFKKQFAIYFDEQKQRAQKVS